MSDGDSHYADRAVGSPRDHVVQFYEDEEFLARSVSVFVGSALKLGNSGIVICTQEHRESIEQNLSDFGIDVASSQALGQLVMLDAKDTLERLMRDQLPRAELFESVIGALVEKTTADGGRVSAFGEMVALLWSDGKCEAAVRLEELWNDLLKRCDVSLLCAYPLKGFSNSDSGDDFGRICAEHTSVLPAESYDGSERAGGEQLRVVAMLQQKAAALASEIGERKRAEQALKEESRTRQILQRVATYLVEEQDIERVIQRVTDAGCELSGAAFGAFFYNVEDSDGDSYNLCTLSGVPSEAFSRLPNPRKTPLFARTFEGEGTVRLGDVTKDSRYGAEPPYFGMPEGHLPVRSYLAVPVVSKGGEVLGGLFFGNPEPDVFTEAAEDLVITLAAQAAVAIENSNLQAALRRELGALRRAEEKNWQLAAIVESSDDAIVGKTLEGLIQTWNAGAQRIFGYAPSEVIGKPITMLFPPGHLNEETEIIRRIRRGERVEHYETIRRRKDGSLIDISLTVSPIRNSAGEVVGASKIARDITQRKRAEQELSAANEALARSRDELEIQVQERTASLREAVAQMEEFSYTVSHDLRAPLRAMSVHCAVLSEEFRHLFESEPEALRSIDRITENCTRLEKMVRDILTYGRVARDEVTLEPVSLDELVQSTISHYPGLQPPLAEIHVDHLGEVVGHEPSLVQVVSNLLTNAVKFVAPGVTPNVRVWTERSNGISRLWVADNGIGIDPKHHHRLFNMFERIHPKLPYEGTGIGLAIVRKAADRMGGRVGVESSGGGGARFWIELPMVDRA